MTEVKISKEYLRALMIGPLQACVTTARSDDQYVYLGIEGPSVPKDALLIEIVTIQSVDRSFKEIL